MAAGAADAITDGIRLVAVPASTSVELLPIDAAAPDVRFGFLSAVGLLALAVGLLRGKRLAWYFAIAIYGVSFETLVAWEPVGAILSGLALAALVVGRRRFDVETGPAWRRCVLVLMVAGIGLVLVSSMGPAGSAGVPAGLAAALGAGSDPALFRGSGDGPLALTVALSHVLFVLASLAILAAVPEPRTDDETRKHAQGIVAQAGGDGLVPFQLDPAMHVFAPGNSSNGIAYGLAGRTAVILGDPFGPPAGREETLKRFVADSHPRDRIVAFYQASSAARQMLVAKGWHTYRIGDEAVVELAGFDLAGGTRANLRHTVRRSARAGVHVRWFPDGIRGVEFTGLRTELAAVDRAWRRGRGPELTFSISRFSTAAMEHVAAAVAYDDHDRVVAFTTFRPTGPGWVLDLTRRLADGPPGSIERCVATAAGQFRAMGALTLSLGLAPLASIGGSGCPIEERLLALTSRLVRPWYDVEGLRFFKAKFDPTWQPRYCAVRRRRDSVPLMVALLRLHLGGIVHALAALR